MQTMKTHHKNELFISQNTHTMINEITQIIQKYQQKTKKSKPILSYFKFIKISLHHSAKYISCTEFWLRFYFKIPHFCFKKLTNNLDPSNVKYVKKIMKN